MTRLIGFAGRAGCGKIYAAQYLTRFAGFEQVAFAGPIKDMMRALGITEAEIDGNLKETPSIFLSGKTPRFAMQTLGTEWGRGLIGTALWTKAWARKADALLDSGRGVVADDVRFPNEIYAIRSRGGRVFWVDHGTYTTPPSHVSEALDPTLCDGTLINNGGEEFMRSVASVVMDDEVFA